MRTLIYCLIGVFILTFAAKIWITVSPIEYSGTVFSIVDNISHLLRWPSIFTALILSIVYKQKNIKAGQKPSKIWMWILVIIGLSFLLTGLFFLLIMFGAHFI